LTTHDPGQRGPHRRSSKRKRAEEALRESQEVLSLYMRHSPVYTYIKAVTSTESRLLQASDNLGQLVGMPARDMVGKTMAELWPTEFAAKMTADDWAVVSGGRVLELEEEFDGRSYATIKFPIVQGAKTLLAGYTVDITERKQMEESLRRTQFIVDHLQDYIHWVSPEGRLLYVNDASCRRLGYSREELLGMTVYDIDPVAPQPWSRHFQEIRERGSFTFESLHRAKDGEIFPVEVTVNYVNYADQEYNCASARDISERRRTEEALRESQSRVINAQRLGKIGDWEWIPAENKVIWSAEMYAIFGIAPETVGLTSEMSVQAFHPEDRAMVAEATRKALEEGKPQLIECRILKPDGTIGYVCGRGEAVLDADGRLVKMTGIYQDITERKQSEEALRESHERFQLANRATYNVIWDWDLKTHALWWNENFQALFGYAPEDIEPGIDSWTSRIHPDDVDRVTVGIHAAIDSGQQFWSDQYRFCSKNGTYLDIEDRAYASRDSDGTPVRMIGAMRDITERKQAEEERAGLETQLRQAHKMESVGRLAGGVAHDFNNMLGVILGRAEMALEQVDPGQPLHDDLEEIRQAAERSAHLTRQLLAFARKQIIAPKVLDLSETVESMLSMLKRVIGEDIDLSWQPQADLWSVKVDPSQIDQILANLCVNARDAIGGIGKMTIETANSTLDAAYCAHHAGYVPGEYVRLAVSDDGPGMARETLSHIFEPFFTTKGVGEGTGLGLATVYGIVKQNNGFINVYSEPDQGTTFTIYLPRHAGKAERPWTEAPAEPAARGHETILLVEDEPAILRLTTRLLEGQGYTVLAASTPSEAIRLARDHAGEIPLLITDVVMPEMNGRDLAKNLLSLHPDLKQLFTSGYTADVIAHNGVLDEGVHFIQKPFSTQDLAAKVREVLDGE
jgi:two-component system cell cycle sensor histidine kinase/response regulator CckA